MTPTTEGGPADTLFSRMENGELGALVPAGQARQQLGLSAEGLRRLGDVVEGLLGCPLPTSGSGGRQYPAQLLVLLAEARAQRAARRATSQEAALAQLLVQEGWLDGVTEDAVDEGGTAAELHELIASLQMLRRSLAGVAPGLLGAAEEQQEATAELLETLRRVTLELPQVTVYLERMRLNQDALERSTRRLGQDATELMQQANDLHWPAAGLLRDVTAIRHTLWWIVWWLGGLSVGAGAVLVLLARGHVG